LYDILFSMFTKRRKFMPKNTLLVLILSFFLSGCMPDKPVEPPKPPPLGGGTDGNVMDALQHTGTQSPHSSQNGAKVGKHALLIGIDNYRNVPPLRGALNDINLTQQLLRERFGFQPDDFIILLDEQATHTGIENAFKALIKRVKRGDLVYIHYSGHGSQTADLNGDERDQQDETWVSYGTRSDNRQDKDNYDVLDDEINAWLTAIYTKTTHVIFVSDSCHSATVARGQAPIGRGLKRDEQQPHNPLGKKAYRQKYQGIHVGAVRDEELAAETTGDDDKTFYGLFTWYWIKALQQAQPGETWHDVFKRAYTPIVARRGQVQNPQMEGERNRQVFGGHFLPLAKTVSVGNAKGDSVEIKAGHVAGVTKGSVYRSQPQHANPKSLPSLTITEVKAFRSFGKASKAGAFKSGDLVVEESHAYHFKPIKLYLSADFPNDKDRPLLQAIRAAFQANPDGTLPFPGYRLTNDPYQAELHLYLLRPKRQNGLPIRASADDALPKSFVNQAPELWVLTNGQRLLHKNLQIRFDSPSNGIQLLRDNLNKLARVRELKALQSRGGGPLPVTVQVTVYSPINACPPGAACVMLSNNLGLHRKMGTYPLLEIEKHSLSKGDILSFSLHNESNRNYYVYLINIGADGAIYALFPAPEERMEYARLKPGEKRELAGEVLLKLEAGEETLKVIASRRPIDVSLLEQEIFRERGSDLNPLERLLTNAVHGERGLSRVSNSEWVTGQVTFVVD
jgi:hypothetical protein